MVRESKNFCTNYLIKFPIDLDGTWYAVETCWVLFNFVFILSCPVNIPGREPYLGDCVKKEIINVGLHLDTMRLVSFRIGLKIDIITLYISVPV